MQELRTSTTAKNSEEPYCLLLLKNSFKHCYARMNTVATCVNNKPRYRQSAPTNKNDALLKYNSVSNALQRNVNCEIGKLDIVRTKTYYCHAKITLCHAKITLCHALCLSALWCVCVLITRCHAKITRSHAKVTQRI